MADQFERLRASLDDLGATALDWKARAEQAEAALLLLRQQVKALQANYVTVYGLDGEVTSKTPYLRRDEVLACLDTLGASK